jgi:hypothetical protein
VGGDQNILALGLFEGLGGESTVRARDLKVLIAESVSCPPVAFETEAGQSGRPVVVWIVAGRDVQPLGPGSSDDTDRLLRPVSATSAVEMGNVDSSAGSSSEIDRFADAGDAGCGAAAPSVKERNVASVAGTSAIRSISVRLDAGEYSRENATPP